jgi:arginyl-tRNA synthetase
MLPGVVQQLEALGLARRDQGALCVFFGDDVWEGVEPKLRKQKEPFIVQKKDGAFLYSTTDLATLLHRRDEVKASKAIYVVDHRQSLHFEQLFAVARRLGVELECHHVGFGTMLGPDGKPLKTRDASGKTITLAALLDEAESRALELMKGAEVELPASELPAVARSVGIGAVKYADLRQNRLSDYQFDWSKMIELKGNSGPYIQYAGARAGAIFRKGEVDRGSVGQAPAVLADPAELALAKVLVRFGDVVHASASELLPHLVTDHLYAVARELSSFYERCPVLKAEGEARAARLTLVALAAGQIEKGLSLLGIDAVERM